MPHLHTSDVDTTPGLCQEMVSHCPLHGKQNCCTDKLVDIMEHMRHGSQGIQII